jgi:hypothetical protein
MTKQELLDQMRIHQTAYSQLASEVREINSQEEQETYEKRQLERFEQYKAKYKFYVKEDGSVKDIDWEEVEKLIKTSTRTLRPYALGFSQYGMEGLGHDYGTGGSFSPMVEDETDARRYIERVKRIDEWHANYNKKK